MLLRYFCLGYFGGKTWPHLLLYAQVYKNSLFCDIKMARTPLIMRLGKNKSTFGNDTSHAFTYDHQNNYLINFEYFWSSIYSIKINSTPMAQQITHHVKLIK